MPRAFYEPQPPEGSTISAPDQPTQRPLSSFSFLCVLSRFSLTWQRALACPPVSGQSVAAGRGCGGWCAIARARSASGSPQRWRSTSCGRASAARSLRSTAAGKVSRCSWAGNGRSGELAEPRAPPPHSPGSPSAPNILGAGMRVLGSGLDSGRRTLNGAGLRDVTERGCVNNVADDVPLHGLVLRCSARAAVSVGSGQKDWERCCSELAKDPPSSRNRRSWHPAPPRGHSQDPGHPRARRPRPPRPPPASPRRGRPRPPGADGGFWRTLGMHLADSAHRTNLVCPRLFGGLLRPVALRFLVMPGLSSRGLRALCELRASSVREDESTMDEHAMRVRMAFL